MFRMSRIPSFKWEQDKLWKMRNTCCPLVDLSTKNKELDSIILEEYPGKIYEGQHSMVGERKNQIYWFYDLELDLIKQFLKKRVYKFKINKGVVIV